MKIAATRADGFVERPDPKIRAVLVYGPDAGLVRERAEKLIAATLGGAGDGFNLVEMDAGDLDADPARLADEAAQISMMGGRRAIRLVARNAADADGAARHFLPFLANAPPGDSLVVVEAGELGPRSKLRGAFEDAPIAAAIACYVEEGAAFERWIAEQFARRKIRIERDALAYLARSLVGDRQIARNEIEKLALYAAPGGGPAAGGSLAFDDVIACVADATAADFDAVAFAVGDKSAAQIERSLARAFTEGAVAIPVLRATARHLLRLHKAVGKAAQGGGAREAMATLRPPVFFKLEERFLAQMRRWTVEELSRGVGFALDAEVRCKRALHPPEAICRNALLTMAASRA